jgi:formylglycine-generating enzyme required for sulfatase activity
MRTLVVAIALAGCMRSPAKEPQTVITTIEPPTQQTPEPDRDRVLVTAPRDMVHVPEGVFPHGCSDRDPHCYQNERPGRPKFISGFFIDRLEVTVADYRSCVQAGACSVEQLDHATRTQDTNNGPAAGSNSSTVLGTSPSEHCNWSRYGRDQHPINCVNWFQAVEYCRWRRKRLPTEAEWMKAARGTEPRVYTWGDMAPSCALAIMNDGSQGCGQNSTSPVGSRQEGRSPYGAYDMGGNVWEWTSDWYGDDYYQQAPDDDPPGPESGIYRIVKGGGWTDRVEGDIDALRISNRYSYGPELRFEHTGFRCARAEKQAGPAPSDGPFAHQTR